MVTPYTRYLGAQNHIPSYLWTLLLVAALSCCSTVPKNQVLGSSDEVLKEAVEAALAVDKRLDTTAIEITVAAGIVELSGTVGSADEVRRALQRAGRVDGVRGIVNRLRVIGRQAGLATDRTVEPSETLQVLNDQ
jgi:hypothetical protein